MQPSAYQHSHAIPNVFARNRSNSVVVIIEQSGMKLDRNGEHADAETRRNENGRLPDCAICCEKKLSNTLPSFNGLFASSLDNL